ncbi:MAG: chromate transporter [Oscillospiraceae bacterium]|nr:chromate transporter [Oscillospiraceae bacterium]
MIYLRLFWEFFKTGMFSIGGGMATLPFLQKMGEATGWFTSAQLADMFAISESTPGPIGVNMATYVGYHTGLEAYGIGGGILGGVIATIGLILPSLLIILLIASLLKSFRSNRYVESAFYGLRPASAALISAALVTLIRSEFFRLHAFRASGSLAALFNWKAWLLAAVLLVLTRWVKPTKKLHPIIFIAFSAVIGIVFSFGTA